MHLTYIVPWGLGGMVWSIADVPLWAELAVVLEVCSCQCQLKHQDLRRRLGATFVLPHWAGLKPTLKYDCGAGLLDELTDNNINFDENKSGTCMSSSCQRFSGSYTLACRGKHHFWGNTGWHNFDAKYFGISKHWHHVVVFNNLWRLH